MVNNDSSYSKDNSGQAMYQNDAFVCGININDYIAYLSYMFCANEQHKALL